MLQWPERRWAYSFASSSSHLHASTVPHSQGPGLNLFFLIAHNCSVDVYFLISSDITGALVIKHRRVEEKGWGGRGEKEEKGKAGGVEGEGKRGGQRQKGAYRRWGRYRGIRGEETQREVEPFRSFDHIVRFWFWQVWGNNMLWIFYYKRKEDAKHF